MKVKELLHSLMLSLLGVCMALAVGEVFIRFATSDQQNYVIEMWRYANLLKRESDNPAIGHSHKPNQSAELQGVDIRINSLGFRGPELSPDYNIKHRIAVVGDSVALGWGVKESETLSGQLEQRLGPEYEVINAGVGNMNLAQIVAHWSEVNAQISVDTVVLLVTPRAAEKQRQPSKSWLLRNSELCALVSSFVQQISLGAKGKSSLIDSYKALWSEGESRNAMLKAFADLSALQARRNFKMLIVMIPETNDMNNYAFGFIGETVAEVAIQYQWTYVDPLNLFKGVESTYWQVSKNDVHLNGKAFAVIADEIVGKL